MLSESMIHENERVLFCKRGVRHNVNFDPTMTSGV
jgi:hypothetical protein